MIEYIITEKATGNEITRYRSPDGNPIQMDAYPADLYDNQVYVAPPPANQEPVLIPVVDKTSYLIDIGPFYDRFGTAKMAVLMSTNPYVKAILEDVRVRKYVNLKRQDVQQAVQVIAGAVPAVTADIVAAILKIPVSMSENAALRSMNYDLSGE